MTALIFDLSIHYREICKWAELRGLVHPPVELLPKTGRIVESHAALFLYKTDSNVGFVENMITNPEIATDEASKALDACIESIEQDARRQGITFLWGASYIPGVASRAQKHGFTVSRERYKLLTKRLV